MKDVTPEERRQALQGLQEAKWLAKELAEHIVNSTDSARIGIFASGMLYASLAAMNGMSMHSAISLLMETYKSVERFEEEHRETDE